MERFDFMDVGFSDMVYDMSELEIIEALEELVHIAAKEVPGYDIHTMSGKKKKLAALVLDMQHVVKHMRENKN